MNTRTVAFFLAIFGACSAANAFVPTKATSFVSTTALSMAASESVKVGDSIPSIVVNELVTGADGPVPINLAELVEGKKVAIFGVPGAFTPGCSKSHLPSFMEAQDDLKAKGVDLTLCLATNDAFVMEAWGRTSGGADAGIRFLSDDSGELTEALGLVKEGGGMLRMQRFSLIAEGGAVTHFFSADEQASDTWAPAVVAAL